MQLSSSFLRSILIGASFCIASAVPVSASAASHSAMYWQWNTTAAAVHITSATYRSARSTTMSYNNGYSNNYYYNNTNRRTSLRSTYRAPVDYSYCNPRIYDCRGYPANPSYNDTYNYNNDYDNNSSNGSYYQGNVSMGTMEKAAFVGENVTITLPASSYGRSGWDPSFDDYAFSLRGHTSGGSWETFTFRALRRGTYRIDFDDRGSGRSSLSYTVYVQ